jgi:hypothetical protein
MRVVVGLLGDEAPEAPGWARAVRVPTGCATRGYPAPITWARISTPRISPDGSVAA